MTELFVPENTGSFGAQGLNVAKILEVEKESPLIGLPITRTVEGLAATKFRSMGGEIAASLIAGSFTQISHELQQTQHELRNTRTELTESNNKLSDCKVKSAVLAERVSSLKTSRHLRNFSIMAGTALIGIGIEFYKNTFEKLAFIIGGLGCFLCLFGWLSPTPKEEVRK